MNMQTWLRLADRVRTEDGYTYAHFAHDLVQQLAWASAVDLVAALRGHVYGQPGGHPLHQAVKPLYDRLGWEQAALVACWFRDTRNRPPNRPNGPLETKTGGPSTSRPAFCDGCNGTAASFKDIAHDPWCTAGGRP